MTVDDVCLALQEFVYLERACANVLAGWVPKVETIELKLAFGAHFAQDLDVATRLLRRFRGLARLRARTPVVAEGLRTLMVAVDRSETPDELVAALYLVVKQELVTLFSRHLDSSDEVADAPTVRLLREAIGQHTEQISWAKRALERPGTATRTRNARSIRRLWEGRLDGSARELESAIWPPLDRVPKVAREKHLRRGQPGAMRVMPLDPLRNPTDIGIFLHNFLNEEITTLELVCRNSYEHPDMPWAFHLEVARHADDEARHAKIVARAAEDFGVAFGDYPIYVSSYEGQYEFEPCEPGSRRELLWRILLRQTFHEGLALDSLDFEVRKRDFLDQPELARIFDFLLSDELFHVESGLRWSRHICGNDADAAMREREAAHAYFLQKVKQTRARYVAENVEAAIAEVEFLESIGDRQRLPFERTLNAAARREAGFTDDELRQIVDWGYASPAET